MAQTAEEYYADKSNWGSGQFIPFKNFIEGMLMETTDPDGYMVNVPRSRIIHLAKEGIRHLTKDLKHDVKAVEITVTDKLYLTLPQDYVDWVRVSVVVTDEVTGSLRLMPLNINNNMNTAIGYLQDHNGKILFDNEGNILTADSSNAYGKPYKKYHFCNDWIGRQFELDTSKLSVWGEFKIDENSGRIVFSSDLEEKEVVIEYTSDGLTDFESGGVKIHKKMYDTLYQYVYYFSILRRKSVPQRTKDDSKRLYLKLKHQAKIDFADFDLNQIIRLAGTATKQL